YFYHPEKQTDAGVTVALRYVLRVLQKLPHSRSLKDDELSDVANEILVLGLSETRDADLFLPILLQHLTGNQFLAVLDMLRNTADHAGAKQEKIMAIIDRLNTSTRVHPAEETDLIYGVIDHLVTNDRDGPVAAYVKAYDRGALRSQLGRDIANFYRFS